jgi:site-specific recombinase XerD
MTKNRRVSLYVYSKVGGSWKYRPAPNRPKNLPEGSSFVIMWYEGENANGKARKRLLNVGRSADVAKVELQRRKAGLLTRIVDGKDAPEPEPDTLDAPDVPAPTVQDAVKKYLEECEDRCGQDGYGFSTNSLKAYKNRLSFLVEFSGDTPLAAVDEQFFKNYRKFLRECKKNNGEPISDRHAHNVMATASGLMLDNKNMSGKKVLSQMSYAEKECCPYTQDELQKFFASCSVKEALVYKFFLHSGGREGEIANMEVRDLLFADGVLWIRSKRDRSFRLKGKKGRASLGRKVPMASTFMRQLEVYCKGKGERDLLFPNTEGGVEGHFLRKGKIIAKRAGLKGFELHRWRKTFATLLHESRVSVRKIQSYLGHTKLDVTLIYLGVSDAADEASQEQINNSTLAAFA